MELLSVNTKLIITDMKGRIYNMTKSQIVDELAKKTGMKKKEAEAAVNAFIETVSDALVAGEKVQIAGFGTFEVKERSERVGRNPFTKEAMTIPASKRLAFTAGKTFKALINK